MSNAIEVAATIDNMNRRNVEPLPASMRRAAEAYNVYVFSVSPESFIRARLELERSSFRQRSRVSVYPSPSVPGNDLHHSLLRAGTDALGSLRRHRCCQ
jgi:hypothetical protein